VSVSDGVITTNLGTEYDSNGSNTSRLRHRFAVDGVLDIDVAIMDDFSAPMPYSLRVWHSNAEGITGARAGGAVATLTIQSRRSADRVTIVPLSRVSSVRDVGSWGIFSQTYKVA
jgi:hypothetical protein